MYNFELSDNEKIVEIFDDILIKHNNKEISFTLVLTDKRVLFLDYIDDYREDLKVGKGINYIRYKELYYQINLIDIKEIIKDKIILKNKIEFQINDNKLVSLIKNLIKGG